MSISTDSPQPPAAAADIGSESHQARAAAKPAIPGESGFGQRALSKGIRWFVFFTVAGLMFVFLWKPPAGLLEAGTRVNWMFLSLSIPLVALDYLLGGIRFRLFFDGSILPRISLWDCIRSNWANLFMGVVTPFATGGGPAQIYILWRKGASVSDSLLVSLINFIATLLFLLVASLAVFCLLPAHLFGGQLTALIRVSAVAVGGLSTVVFFISLYPAAGFKVINAIIRLLPLHRLGLGRWQIRFLAWVENEFNRFDQNFTQIRKQKRRAVVITLMMTLALYFNKYLIGYFIALALVKTVPFGTFIGLEILNYFVSFMAPTPGAAGIAEISSVWLMEKVLAPEVLVIFAALWRGVTVLLGACIGGVVLAGELKIEIKRTLPLDGQ